MARRFFVNSESILPNGTITIVGEEYNHIVNVLRAKENDELTICDNSGFDYICSIFKIEKKSLILKILNKEENKQEPKTKITVFQALVKGDKFDLIAQKLTELGATTLVPFESQFATVKASTTRTDRLQKISVEAAKQCGRAKSLKILPVQTFEQVLKMLDQFDIVVFAYENSKANLKDQLTNKKNSAIIIGSEGGFSTEEVEKLQKHKNVVTISLGNRILRAETACIVLTGIVGYCLKEWDYR